jgi:hypothetical protein
VLGEATTILWELVEVLRGDSHGDEGAGGGL